MAQLTGITQDGTEVPVQVKPDGRLVAEGLDGPPGPIGPAGAAGPAGDSQFQKTGSDVYLSSGRFLVGTSSSSATTRAVFQGNSANASGTGIVQLATGNTSPATGDQLGRLEFGGSTNVGAASIIGDRDGGTWTNGSSQPSKLTFSTTRDGQSSPSPALMIDSQQRVKIQSPNGAWWAITVSDSGALSAVAA